MDQLVLWGSLGDLPSVDAECIATLAYLIHFSNVDQIEISYGSDPSSSSNGTSRDYDGSSLRLSRSMADVLADDFPTFYSGQNCYAGFMSVREHHRQRRSDPSCSDADEEAWSSFVQQRGQALLDLYLYVSSANYWETISPAYTAILPWISNYIVPPARRATAIARTRHLGIRSLDLDKMEKYANGDDATSTAFSPDPSSKLSAAVTPGKMLNWKKSVRWVQHQQHADAFKLYELTNTFFGPLQDLLGDKNYLITDDQPTSLDCVAVAYLSIMLYAEVPQPWLRQALQTRFPTLCAYTKRVYRETFLSSEKLWRTQIVQAEPPTTLEWAKKLARHILHSALPSFKQTIRRQDELTAECNGYSLPRQKTGYSMLSPASLLPIGLVAGVALGFAKFLSSPGPRGPHVFIARESDFLEPVRLADLGESGALLSTLAQHINRQARHEQETQKYAEDGTLFALAVENRQREVGRDVVVSS